MDKESFRKMFVEFKLQAKRYYDEIIKAEKDRQPETVIKALREKSAKHGEASKALVQQGLQLFGNDYDMMNIETNKETGWDMRKLTGN